MTREEAKLYIIRHCNPDYPNGSTEWETAMNIAIEALQQPERIIYANMSDEEFERWLYENGICNPNIHESIPCDVVPLLIDNAISELPSAQPETWCEGCRWEYAFGYGECHHCKRRFEDMYERKEGETNEVD